LRRESISMSPSPASTALVDCRVGVAAKKGAGCKAVVLLAQEVIPSAASNGAEAIKVSLKIRASLFFSTSCMCVPVPPIISISGLFKSQLIAFLGPGLLDHASR
jgi:hypothetical protein